MPAVVTPPRKPGRRILGLAFRLSPMLAIAGLAAAYASYHPPPVPRAVPLARQPAPAHKATVPAKRTPINLVLTVLDGDRRVRVPGAHVSIGADDRRTSATGVARIAVSRPRVTVSVAAAGFSSRTVTLDLRRSRLQTVRIYRPDLQWPMYGVNATRTQAQNAIQLRPPFKTVWSMPMGGLIEFPAVVDDGVAYIGNAHATIRAISMRFGTQLWRHDTPNTEMASSPAVVGDQLVYHTMDGHIVVLDRTDGRLLWSYSVGSPIESSPIVRDGVDYFGDWSGDVYALDLRTHAVVWTRTLGAKITSSASILGSTLYIGDYAGRLWALGVGTGSTRWTSTVNGRIYGTPAVAAGRIFVPSSTGNSLTAFDLAGKQLWRVVTGGYVYSSPATANGRVFFGSYDGTFYAVSASTGSMLWRVGARGPISGAAVVVDGVAYAGSFAHEIVGVDAASGKRLLTFDHGHYVPVSGNGMRLLFHGYSRLYAVEPKTTLKSAATRITASHPTTRRTGP